jgi:hypothetical protein
MGAAGGPEELVNSWDEKQESALDFSVQDASAALPQNCQTTIWILELAPIPVNVTSVMHSEFWVFAHQSIRTYCLFQV